MTRQVLQRKGSSIPALSRAPSAFAPRGFGDALSRLPAATPQAKLTVNQPGDKYEQEADAVADRVLRMGDTAAVAREEVPEEEEPVQAKPVAGAISPLVQREGDEEEEDEEHKPVQAKASDGVFGLLQREAAPEEEDPSKDQASAPAPDAAPGHSDAQTPKALGQETDDEEPVQTKALSGIASSLQRAGGDGASSPDVSGVVQHGLSGGGQTLDDATRAYMEPRFGHDFSQVRIHTDSRASQSSEAIAARAYTVGSDIAFRSGEFNPGSSDGRRLLAHELTHVVQQDGAKPSAAFRQAETKALPNWGSKPNGTCNSTMTLNPHTELWADGVKVNGGWYSGAPGNTTESLTAPAGTKRGEVKIIVDGWWHQNNLISDESGQGTSVISAPFLVNDKNELHFEAAIAHNDPAGNAAQMSGAGASSDNPPDGGAVTAQVAINSTDSASSGHTEGGSIDVKPFGLGAGVGSSYSGSVTTPTGNKLESGYRTEVKLEKPKTVKFKDLRSVFFDINKHKIVQDKLQGQSIQTIYDFINAQPPDVVKLIKDGTVEIKVQAHASKTGDMGHNIELSEKRRDEVVRLMKDFIGAHANLNPTGVGFIEAGAPEEDPMERCVDMSFEFDRAVPSTTAGAAPTP